jgi:hypothetical protein
MRVIKHNIVNYLDQSRNTKIDYIKIHKKLPTDHGDSHHMGMFTFLQAVKQLYALNNIHQLNVLVADSLGSVIK